MKKKLRYFYHVAKELILLKKQELKKPKRNIRPEVINLNANDICNSKCTMCNIWKNKLGKEITYDDLKIIFADPFYAEVRGVGITGGEPTLREDLVDLYRACIDYLPNLTGLSIITNCIKTDVVKKQLFSINQLCKSRGVGFSVMVSLDGYGEVHDRIRGRENNFDGVIDVINYVKDELKLPVSFGATISKENLWEIDELLDFAIDNDLYGRFRVAEFIQRLYNSDRNEVIRNFTDEESYHLALFFERLKRTYEKNKMYQRTYSSIQNMLLGGKRTIGCPYHNKGINLNAKGELAYCAPKSKLLGNAIEQSSTNIYNNNLAEKKRLLKEECQDCIHDYHADITFKEQVEIYQKQFQKKFLTLDSTRKVIRISPFLNSPNLSKNNYTILILGWYGTETVGDKAILAGIIENYKDLYGYRLNIIIGSLYPFITRQTVKELNIEAQVISTSSFEFLRFSKVSNEVIMGGGPLMDLNELYVPLLSFEIAKKYNNKRTIYGCGIGPLTIGKYGDAVRKILELSNNIFLRDYNSINYALKEFNISNSKMIGDPAKTHIKNIKKNLKLKKSKTLSLFLRDWEYAYGKQKWDQKSFIEIKERFESSLASYIKFKANELGVEKISFNHMHNFIIGGDDRLFSRRFIKTYFKDDPRVCYSPKLSTVNSIATQMLNSKFNICMRFHSVLFAETLQTDFIAIDYTLGGKIEAYMSENNMLEQMYSVEKIIDLNNESSTSKYL